MEFSKISLDDLLDGYKMQEILYRFVYKSKNDINLSGNFFDEAKPIKVKYYLPKVEITQTETIMGSMQELIFNDQQELTREFYLDYLFPEIRSLYGRSIAQIEQRRILEHKYSKEERIGFYYQIESEYIDRISKVNMASHLSPKIKLMILDSINETRDYISDQTQNLFNPNSPKIPFELNREDLAVFIFLLRKADIISNKLSIDGLAGVLSGTVFYKGRKPITRSIRTNLYKYAKNGLTARQKDQFKDRFLNLFL